MGLLSPAEQELILHAVYLAENQTSGEIRIAIEKHCKGTPLDRAIHFFESSGMHQTALRNGVLIYVATEDHLFSIIGDTGINRRVPDDFWEETKKLMLGFFQKGDLVSGIEAGIHHIGGQLKTFFPAVEDDINELPDDIIFGK